MKKEFVLFLGVIIIIIGAVMFGGSLGSQPEPPSLTHSNVQMIDGKQIVTIKVDGGYQPEISLVQSGIPTILRFDTNNSFDCSSSIRIPKLNITKTLPATGTTDIAIGSLQPGTLQGSCGMGMYQFELKTNG